MNPAATPIPTELPQPNLRQFLLYFLHLGALGFGGPIALAADLLDRGLKQIFAEWWPVRRVP